MGNKYARPSPLDRYRAGEEDALEDILWSICAPLFDLALHLFHSRRVAEDEVAAALRKLADEVRAGAMPGDSPGAAAARHLSRSLVRAPDAGDVADIPFEHGADPIALMRSLSELSPSRWSLLAHAHALDLEGEEWRTALSLVPEQALAEVEDIIAGLGVERSTLRAFMDARAARANVPHGLVERALASEEES